MKILLASHSPNDPDGGASRIYHMLNDAWRAKGVDVVTLHLEDFKLPANRKAALAARRLNLPTLMSRQLGMPGRLDGVDVLMFSSGHGGPLFRKLRQAGGRRPLLVNHLHGLAVFDDLAARHEAAVGRWPASTAYRLITGPMQNRWDANGVREADLSIVQNLRDLGVVEAQVPEGRDVVAIPPAVHPELLERSREIRPPEERNRNHILWFGSWEPRKGAALVPRAFRLLRQQFPEARLTLGGTGMPAARIGAFFAPEDRDNLRVLPRISLEEQTREFNDAAILLFPSLSEGFGLALAEAMCFGCAAVTTPTGFGADSLMDGRDARVVYPSSHHVARALADLVANDDARPGIARSGREVARGLTIDLMAGRYMAAFEASLGRRRAAA